MMPLIIAFTIFYFLIRFLRVCRFAIRLIEIRRHDDCRDFHCRHAVFDAIDEPLSPLAALLLPSRYAAFRLIITYARRRVISLPPAPLFSRCRHYFATCDFRFDTRALFHCRRHITPILRRHTYYYADIADIYADTSAMPLIFSITTSATLLLIAIICRRQIRHDAISLRCFAICR